jgi:predicted Zn-dependent peptidase
MSRIVTGQLDCGAALVVEPIPSVASVALNWLLPVGAATDPPDGDGLAAMLGELIFRGAGRLDSRGHSDALDRLGVQRSSQVLTHHLRLTATLVGDRLRGALPLLADMVTAPALPADAVDAVRSLCLQSLDGLDDEPQHLVMLRLRERHLPPPFHRHGYGDRSVLQQCAIETLRASWAERCRPGGSILAAAGAVDPDALAGQLNELLADWSGTATPTTESGAPPRGHDHTAQDTAQMHIGLAYDAPRESDPKSMHERLAVGVLSGGTSARLFTEVRQKRSLCYSVGASYGAGRDYGLVTLYAGTTPERAQETLDVCSAEIERLADGVTGDELDRAVIGLKSHLIMQGESTAARAAAIGSDYFRLGRARTLDELAREVDAITSDALNDYLASRRFGDLTVASVGPGKSGQLPISLRKNGTGTELPAADSC